MTNPQLLHMATLILDGCILIFYVIVLWGDDET